jgi:hypothetical protein
MSPRSKNAPPHRSRRSRQKAAPPGKYAQEGPRLIGYGLILLALLLIAIGSVFA